MPHKSIPANGSRAQVWHGNAKHTSGGLFKKDLMKNRHGRIVSRRRNAMGHKSIHALRAAGFVTHRGVFKLFPKGSSTTRRRHHKTARRTKGHHTRRAKR